MGEDSGIRSSLSVSFPFVRLRRLRSHPLLRELVRESRVEVSDLVFPLFIKGEEGKRYPIPSMPGIDQIPLSELAKEVEELVSLGIYSVILFGIPSYKDSCGTAALEDQGIVQRAIREIRKIAPEMLIIVDLCLCEYTDHGHCGILDAKTSHIDNDETLKALSLQALSLVRAGADVIAPSGMIDGMVYTLRETLDGAGFVHTPILSYSVKYCSSLYAPFRDAAEGAPKFGDRRTHQLDPANGQEALREAVLDVREGADLLMVKPAHTYLDIIYRVKQSHPQLPLGAYHTSGEYVMIKAAACNGWIDEKQVVSEVLIACKRAGADFIITYYAKEFAKWANDTERDSKIGFKRVPSADFCPT